MAKGDAQLLREIRELVDAEPLRGGDPKQAFQKIRVLLHTGKLTCPMCGHPVNWQDGTHVEHGYREPHIQPYLPGSWLADTPLTPK